MFIDINSYVGHWPFRNIEKNTLEELSELAGAYGVTHMMVANLNGLFYKDANVANLELLKWLESYKGKVTFLPMAIVNPTYPCWEKDAREMIKRGFVGFEIAPIYHKYSLAPELLYDEYMAKHRALEVLTLAEELDVPVRICASFENFRGRSELDDYRNVTGDELYALLSKNKNVHTFITSFSPIASGEKFKELLSERKNTYFDTTQVEPFNSSVTKRIWEFISSDQLCFGSLSPFNYMEGALLRMELAEGFDAEKMKTNAKRAFKALRA